MTKTPPLSSVRVCPRRLILSVAAIGILLMAGIPFMLGFGFLFALTHSPCQPDNNPGDFGLPYEDVDYPSSEFAAHYAAYFIPGTTNRTMIIVPALGAGRGDLMDAISVYHARGYNVLTYRARLCFGVTHSLGYTEVTAIGDALAYLRTRRDIDPDGIALHGFSAGGAAALLALARYPELRTAVAHGGYADFERLLDAEARSLGGLAGLFTLGARFAYRLSTGVDISALKPIEAISHSAPRPILLVYGSLEVSLEGAYTMRDAAPERVQLWVVEDAGHGNYIEAAGRQRYGDVVVGFLDMVFNDPAPNP